MSITLPQNYRPTDREPFMNAMQQEYFRQKLLKWKAELVEESNQTLQNMQECAQKGRLNRVRGEKAKFAKLKTEQVLEIREAYQNGAIRNHLAKQYGVDFKSIDRIIKRKHWKHI